MAKTEKRAVIYMRYSPRPSDRQGEDSLQNQFASCLRYCEERGYAVFGEPHVDADMSGADENRPGLWSAIDSLRQGMVLVVHRMDRLARNVMLSEIIRRDVAKRGASIEAVYGSVNGDTAEAVMIRQIMAAVSEYERKIIASRTSMATRQFLRSGRCVTSSVPYGWRLSTEQVVMHRGQPKTIRFMEHDPHERAVMAMVRVMLDRGFGERLIAKVLTNQGVARRNNSSEWCREAVRTVRRALVEEDAARTEPPVALPAPSKASSTRPQVPKENPWPKAS